MTCAGCGFELSADFAFCPRCGLPRPAAAVVRPRPAAPADRREVTVLFADLCDFTALSERLDAEQVREFQEALFPALAAVITRYGGFVAKYLGDAVLALFGAPVALEDAPERAIDAALAMQAEADRLGEAWAERLGQPIVLHIAVHTGPVVAGHLGDGAGAAYDVTGDAVNTASRLLGAAAPGTILVSATTHALAQHRFAFAPAETVALKGKSEPVVVHRLTGTLAAPQPARGLARLGLASRLVGRTRELEQLQSTFARLQHGRAQLVSVAGEAGSGKSRLLAEFLAGLASGITVRRVTCSSLGEAPYGAFAGLFREGYRIGLGDSLEQARRKLGEGLKALGAAPEIGEALAPVIGYLLGVEEAPAVEVDPEQLKRQIVLAGRTLIERRLEQGPLLIVIDDFQWADTASIDLVRDAVDHFADRRLMVLLAHRPDARPPRVERAEQTALRLSPLSPDDARAFLSGMFGSRDPGFARLSEVIASRAGGNPLFVEEIVRSLVTSGVLVRDDGGWRCTAERGALAIPATLHGLLLSRVDRLAAGTRQVLQTAAVLGPAFEQPLLDAVAPDAGAELGRLVEADLLRPSGAGAHGARYQFAHALVQEAVYGNLLQSRRAELHERAARALEAIAGALPSRLSDLEALGHHWSFTADKEKGGRYLMIAGDRARSVYANDDAIRYYERAGQTLAACAWCEAQVRVVRERLGDLYALTARQAEALAHYQTVRADAEASGDRLGAARLYRKVGGVHWEAGDRDRASACFAAGLQQLGEDGHPIERANLYQEIGRLAFRAGDSAGAIAWADKALAEAAKEPDGPAIDGAPDKAATLAQAYNTLGVALARTGRVQEAADRIAQSIALAESRNLLQATCRGYTNLGVLLSSLDPRRSIETCLKGLEIAKKVGDLAFQSRLYANLAVAYCALTDRCEAEGLQAAETAIDLDRRLGLIDHLAVPLIVLGQIRQCHGDHSLALESYREALVLAEQIGEPQLLFPCYDGLATLHLDAGNGAMAEQYFAKAQEVCDRAGLEPDALLVLPFLC